MCNRAEGIILQEGALGVNGVQRTPYIFTLRVLNGVRGVDLGGEPFRDVELNEAAMRHESGKIAGIQQGLYTGATGENDDGDDA